VHVDAAQANKKSPAGRAKEEEVVAADGGGSSLKLVVASQPPTISQIVPASAATGRHGAL